MPEILQFQIRETKATCHDCAMTVQKRDPRARTIYQAHLKCCTFEPRLPNYLVGEFLATVSTPSPGLRQKLAEKTDCLPLAVLPSAEYTRKFTRRKPGDFGQREDLLCSYYDRKAQNCSIWRSRGSVCTAFYCMSDLGAQGLRFWKALGDFLHHVEMALAEEALTHLDFSPRQVSEQLEFYEPSKNAKSPNPERWKQLWNSYADPEQFYRKAHQFVENLTREGFEEALGEIGLKLERKLLSQIRRIQLSRSKHGS